MMQRYWSRMSIRTKAVITQVVIIIVPLFLCLFVLVQQIATETRLDTALTTYQYNRSFIQTLDTSVRQIESLANSIAGNRYVRNYVAMEPGEEQDALFQEHISGLLRYAYNRYLPTNEINILTDTTLNDLSFDDELIHVRSAYRLWTFTPQADQIQNRFYYQFTGTDNKPGVLVFMPASNMLTDYAATIAAINDQKCAIFSTDGVALYLPAESDEAQAARLASLAASSTEGYTVLDDGWVGYCVRSEVLQLLFVSMHRVDITARYWNRVLPLFMLFLALMGACVFLTYRTFFSNITKRILRLSSACESLSLEEIASTKSTQQGLQYETDVAASVPGQGIQTIVPIMGVDEIGRLSASINDMLGRITELAYISEREAMLSQRAAYDMLAAQIHPHFIYNTLENLRMMAEVNDDGQLADQLYALARMLRLSISDATSTGAVSMEIEHVQTYLQLQKMRMNDMLDYEIEPVPPEISSVKCPRFLLQPLVENAIKHGFSEQEKAGCIHITSGKYRKGIYLRVQDNGRGIDPEKLDVIRESLQHDHAISTSRQSIGLDNVNSRLRMFYGPEAKLTIESAPGEGTICTLWLANQP